MLSRLRASMLVLAVLTTVAIPGFSTAAEGLEPIPLGAVTAGLYAYALRIAGLAVFIMFLVAGLAKMIPQLASSVGKPEDIIKDAIIGLIILVSAFVILNSINPALVGTGVQ